MRIYMYICTYGFKYTGVSSAALVMSIITSKVLVQPRPWLIKALAPPGWISRYQTCLRAVHSLQFNQERSSPAIPGIREESTRPALNDIYGGREIIGQVDAMDG